MGREHGKSARTGFLSPESTLAALVIKLTAMQLQPTTQHGSGRQQPAEAAEQQLLPAAEAEPQHFTPEAAVTESIDASPKRTRSRSPQMPCRRGHISVAIGTMSAADELTLSSREHALLALYAWALCSVQGPGDIQTAAMRAAAAAIHRTADDGTTWQQVMRSVESVWCKAGDRLPQLQQASHLPRLQQASQQALPNVAAMELAELRAHLPVHM